MRNEDRNAHEAAGWRQESQEKQLQQRMKKRMSVAGLSLPSILHPPGGRKSTTQKLLCMKQSLPGNKSSVNVQLDGDMQKD